MNRLFKMAIRLGVTNAVQLYIANGMDLNATDDGGMSPLMCAADAGQVQICRILLEAGADPLQCNDEGRDAHFFALKNGSSEVVGVLREFLGNRAKELQKRREDFQPGAVDSDFDYADRPRTYHNKEFHTTGWEEYSESPPPTGDPLVGATAAKIQSLISLYITRETDEDWSDVEIDLPKVDGQSDSRSDRSQIYILEIGGIYLTCHPEVYAKHQASLSERASLSTSELNSLFLTIRADLDSLNNAESGRKTVWSVVDAIVCRQQDFLAKGTKHLKPMMLRDIADEVGINISTASRIVNRVWAHTPQGIIRLRALFSGSILNEDGEEVSTQAIKQMVKDLLLQEPETIPITDEQIVSRLRKENIRISRRTVAKYRKQLEILGSRERAKRLSYTDVSEGIVKKPSRLKAGNTSRDPGQKIHSAKSEPRKNRLEEMGEQYFKEAGEAMGAEEYERAIGLLHATILCGYRPAESLYQFARAHLEIVSHRTTSLSLRECRGEDIRHHLTAAINGLTRAIKLEPDFKDAYIFLGIAYALFGDKDSAFRQKTALEGLDSPAADKLRLSLDFILARHHSS